MQGSPPSQPPPSPWVPPPPAAGSAARPAAAPDPRRAPAAGPPPGPPPGQPPAGPTPPPVPRRRWRVRHPKRLLLVLLVLVALAALSWQRCGIRGCPDVARLGAYQPDGAPLVLDRYGEEVGELALTQQVVVSLEDLPDHVPEAFLAVEDKRFPEHNGVDWRRVGGALFANVRAGGIREGSSTITMQLARNLFAERIPGEERTFSRKMLEVRVARQIEKAYEKDEILELYLNHIYFGGGTRGIEAASQYYFRKPASDLTLREAALLAALPKAPTHYDPRNNPEGATERRNLVLALMAEQGKISAEEAEEAQGTTLGVRKRGRRATQPEPFAGYFLERVRTELEERFGDSLYRGRVRVVTTLDRRAQRAAERELEAQLARIERGTWGRFRGPRYASDLEGDEEGTDYLQGAVVMMEAETGDVLAWVGGREFRHSHFDRAAQARRQMGSAFKPFVFAAAIGAGVLPTQQLSDLPLTLTFAGGEVWEPRNFGDSYLPVVTVRQALVESRNVATVRLAESIGPGRVADLAEDFGIRRVSTLPSTALGADTASPLALTQAYSAFANLGERAEPRFILRIEDEDGEAIWEADEPRREEVVDPAVAYVVTDMMREGVRSGTGAPAAAVGLRVPAAGKTGTTNERQDVWFVGYTPDVVATVWIGFDQPRTIVPGASGGRLAAPLWGRIMRSLYQHRDRPSAWPVPRGVTVAQVDRATGVVLAEGCAAPSGRSYREAFLAGTEPPAYCPGGQPGIWARFRNWWETAPPAGDNVATGLEEMPTPMMPSEYAGLPPYELEGVDIGVLPLPEQPAPLDPGFGELGGTEPGGPPADGTAPSGPLAPETLEPIPIEPPAGGAEPPAGAEPGAPVESPVEEPQPQPVEPPPPPPAEATPTPPLAEPPPVS